MELLEAEWRGRHQRGVESRLRLARLPWVKSLAGLSFIERAENVVLMGPPAWARATWPSASASKPSRPATRSCS
jgi:hypothetical protein